MSGQFILSSIILFGGIQGLFIVAALQRLKQSNQPANRILSIFVLLISLVLFSRLVYVEGINIWQQYPHLFLLPDIPMFFYGPLFFLYIRELLSQQKFNWRIDWPHFIPALIHLFVLIFYLFESKAEYGQRLQTGNLIEVPLAIWISLVQIAIYISWGYFLFKKNQQKIVRQQKFKFGKKYIVAFFATVSICWCCWFYSVLSDQIELFPSITFFNYNISWVAFSFASFLLAYFAMSKPEVFREDPAEKRYEGSLLSDSALDKMEKKLTQLMENDKPFTDPQLSQQDLADQMGMSSKDLSRLINDRLGQHFFDFVNAYRVDEFKRLAAIPDNQHLTLLALAHEAGFNSKTTFNTAFKKVTGMTPSQFIKASTN